MGNTEHRIKKIELRIMNIERWIPRIVDWGAQEESYRQDWKTFGISMELIYNWRKRIPEGWHDNSPRIYSGVKESLPNQKKAQRADMLNDKEQKVKTKRRKDRGFWKNKYPTPRRKPSLTGNTEHRMSSNEYRVNDEGENYEDLY